SVGTCGDDAGHDEVGGRPSRHPDPPRPGGTRTRRLAQLSRGAALRRRFLPHLLINGPEAPHPAGPSAIGCTQPHDPPVGGVGAKWTSREPRCYMPKTVRMLGT